MKGLYSLRRHVWLLPLLLMPSVVLADEWRQYTSQNFNVYSDDDPGRCVDLLKQFEVFRHVVLTLTGLPDKPENAKMQVLVFDSDWDYKKIGPANSAGFYIDTARGPRMVVGAENRIMKNTDVLYHEYIHYLIRQHSSLRYPRWYDEGFAEFLGATTIEDGVAVIGGVPGSREAAFTYLRPMGVSHLLEPDPDRRDSGRYQGRFYAYAWLLVHYLQINAYSSNPDLQDQIRDFLVRYDAGEAPIETFETSFGISTDELDKLLEDYREQKRLTTLTMQVDEFRGDIRQRSLSPSETAWLLGDLAYRVGEEGVALDYLEEADPGEPGTAQALSLAAVIENHNENTQRAGDYAERALAMAPTNSVVLTNLSHLAWDNYEHAGDAGETGEQALNNSLAFSERALESDPENLETYSFAWEAYRARGENLQAVKTLMAAYQLAPFSVGINESIGNLLFDLDKRSLAQPFLERVVTWSHSEEQREAAAEKLETIESAGVTRGES